MRKHILFKAVSFAFALVSLTGCFYANDTSCSEDTDSIISKPNDERDESSITFEVGTYDDKNWNDPVGTYNGDAIPNKDVALNVAKQIFDGMDKSEETSKMVPQTVFYDETDQIWIVSFWEPHDPLSEYVTFGYCCSIAITKHDGKVLRIWFGE